MKEKEYPQANPYPIRLPKDLKAKIEESATRNSRSLNAEMVLRLESTFNDTVTGNANYLTQSQVQALIDQAIDAFTQKLNKAGIKLND
jgi:hypothetical protein